MIVQNVGNYIKDNQQRRQKGKSSNAITQIGSVDAMRYDGLHAAAETQR